MSFLGGRGGWREKGDEAGKGDKGGIEAKLISRKQISARLCAIL